MSENECYFAGFAMGVVFSFFGYLIIRHLLDLSDLFGLIDKYFDNLKKAVKERGENLKNQLSKAVTDEQWSQDREKLKRHGIEYK